jgi:DMSO reductase anchor subunit
MNGGRIASFNLYIVSVSLFFLFDLYSNIPSGINLLKLAICAVCGVVSVWARGAGPTDLNKFQLLN